MNRDMIDQAAVDFVYLNSASGRQRLAKVLLQVPRGRLDLLPYYSRFIATLNRYITDIGEQVLKGLESEFRGLFKKKDQTEILETRIRNIRFLSELAKFRVTPYHVILQCLKRLLEHFSGHNIEVACNLLETCGRFLYKNPDTAQRFTTMVLLSSS
jgi:regulator of nonsense transcripts 2